MGLLLRRAGHAVRLWSEGLAEPAAPARGQRGLGAGAMTLPGAPFLERVDGELRLEGHALAAGGGGRLSEPF